MEDFDFFEEEMAELVERFKLMQERGSNEFFDSEDLVIIINEFLDKMNLEDAAHAIDYGMKLFPDDIDFRVLRTKQYILEMKFNQAEEELEYIEAHFLPTIDFYIVKVLFARMAGEDIDTFQLLKKALKLDDSDPEVNFLISYEFLKKKDVANALKHVIFALKDDELYDEQLYNFSYLIEESKQYEDGIAFYSKLAEEFPMSAGCWFGLGLAYSLVQDFDKAIDAYRNVLSINEDTPSAHYNIANCYFEYGNYDAAITHYREALVLDPEDFSSMTCIGDCFALKNEDDQAMDYYHMALEINPNHQQAVIGIAEVLQNRGQDAEARVFIEKAFALNPQNFDMMFNVLPFYDEDKQQEKLRDFFEVTLNQVENKSDFFTYFLMHCRDNQLYAAGIDILEQYKDNPDVTDEIGYYLAALYFLNHQEDKGKEYLANALLIDYVGYQNFLNIDPILETFSEITELIELYKPE